MSCKYCDGSFTELPPRAKGCPVFVDIINDHNDPRMHLTTEDWSVFSSRTIHYCPMCGRNLHVPEPEDTYLSRKRWAK